MNTYVLLDEYIPEIKFKGKLLNSDVVTAGKTVTFDASESLFTKDYAGIIHGFYNFPKNHAEGVTGYVDSGRVELRTSAAAVAAVIILSGSSILTTSFCISS